VIFCTLEAVVSETIEGDVRVSRRNFVRRVLHFVPRILEKICVFFIQLVSKVKLFLQHCPKNWMTRRWATKVARSEGQIERKKEKLIVGLLCDFLRTTYEPLHLQRIRGCIQNFPDCVDNEINSNNKQSLRSNTKGYGGKTH
jgi:hypothetical protein